MRWLKLTIYLSFIIFISSCGNGGDGEGKCVLNCTNAVMNSDVQITPLIQSSKEITCTANTQAILFREYAAFKLVQTDSISENSGAPMPAGYIRIVPALYSAESEGSIQELREGRDGTWISAVWDPKILDDSDYYLRGIITPQENFCTNSCGIFEIEYTLRCPPFDPLIGEQNSDVTLEIRSGNVNSFQISTITVKDKEDN